VFSHGRALCGVSGPARLGSARLRRALSETTLEPGRESNPRPTDYEPAERLR